METHEMNTPLGCLDDMPRARLCHAPTPLEDLPNLSRTIGGPRLLVKRDDCTGLGLGGNKVRQLEFYMGAATAAGADTVLITGAVQSNFVRLATAAARKVGLDCHIQLEQRVEGAGPAYHRSGNVLIDRILGATLHSYPVGEDEAGADRQLSAIAETLRGQGRTPYIIPLSPGHPPLGALGYVEAARELLEQIRRAGVQPDRLVVASGSGATHAGLLFGLRALGSPLPVTGICVRRDRDLQVPRIGGHCHGLAALLEMDNPVSDADIQLDDRHLPPGYGKPNDAVLDAMRLAARCEGLLLDPVYTGRAMAGFLGLAREAGPEQTLLFVHTGGQPALFAYEEELAPILAPPAVAD